MGKHIWNSRALQRARWVSRTWECSSGTSVLSPVSQTLGTPNGVNLTNPGFPCVGEVPTGNHRYEVKQHKKVDLTTEEEAVSHINPMSRCISPPFEACMTISIKEKTAKSRGTFLGIMASDPRSRTHPLVQPRSTACLLQEHRPWDLVVLTAGFNGIFVLSDN